MECHVYLPKRLIMSAVSGRLEFRTSSLEIVTLSGSSAGLWPFPARAFCFPVFKICVNKLALARYSALAPLFALGEPSLSADSSIFGCLDTAYYPLAVSQSSHKGASNLRSLFTLPPSSFSSEESPSPSEVSLKSESVSNSEVASLLISSDLTSYIPSLDILPSYFSSFGLVSVSSNELIIFYFNKNYYALYIF